MIEAEPRPISNSMPRLAPYADASNANACSQGGPAPTDYLMETVFIQIRAPKGNDAGKVLEGPYKVIGDVVTLVDKGGKALASDDKKYSRNLVAGEKSRSPPSSCGNITMRRARARVISIGRLFIPNWFTDFAAFLKPPQKRQRPRRA